MLYTKRKSPWFTLYSGYDIIVLYYTLFKIGFLIILVEEKNTLCICVMYNIQYLYNTRMLCSVIIICMWSYFTWRCFSLSIRVVRVCAIIIFIVGDVLFYFSLSLSPFLFENNLEDLCIVYLSLYCTLVTNIKWVNCCGVRPPTNGSFSSKHLCYILCGS